MGILQEIVRVVEMSDGRLLVVAVGLVRVRLSDVSGGGEGSGNGDGDGDGDGRPDGMAGVDIGYSGDGITISPGWGTGMGMGMGVGQGPRGGERRRGRGKDGGGPRRHTSRHHISGEMTKEQGVLVSPFPVARAAHVLPDDDECGAFVGQARRLVARAREMGVYPEPAGPDTDARIAQEVREENIGWNTINGIVHAEGRRGRGKKRRPTRPARPGPGFPFLPCPYTCRKLPSYVPTTLPFVRKTHHILDEANHILPQPLYIYKNRSATTV